jgi:hypothetical protein
MRPVEDGLDRPPGPPGPPFAPCATISTARHGRDRHSGVFDLGPYWRRFRRGLAGFGLAAGLGLHAGRVEFAIIASSCPSDKWHDALATFRRGCCQ